MVWEISLRPATFAAMRHILIIGAGRSASSLIRYLLDRSETEQLHLVIGDLSKELAETKTAGHPNATPIAFDVANATNREAEIRKADLVISMLPAHMHVEVARDCIALGKNMVTASYVSEAMHALDQEVRQRGLVFMNEIGLDPGIDHMSAMKLLDEIRSEGGHITAFESHCGGLVAPESDDNLWRYKFSWAPRNVVLAGQGGVAKFLENGTYKYIPYQQLFRRTWPLSIDGYGDFEVYANRDSLKYRSAYRLDNVNTLLRGTIRRAGYSAAWDILVQLGLTDDTYTVESSETLTHRDFLNMFLPYHPTKTVEEKLRAQFDIDAPTWQKLQELELFSANRQLGLANATPAQWLERLLSEKWVLRSTDKDMIVMYHRITYERNGQVRQRHSQMVVTGDDQTYTAMAKTVGLPVAIAALRILNGNITSPGVQIPLHPDVYQPILAELEQHGIRFSEKDNQL